MVLFILGLGSTMAEGNIHDTTLSAFIWKNAEDLWGDFKHVDFGKIILPFTLLRRLECVLEPTRDKVLELHAKHKDSGIDVDLILRQATELPFYNTSRYSLATLGGTKTRQNLEAYIAGFSDNARKIFDQFDFINTIARLHRADILFKICQNFAATDLHPEVVPERVMSNVYEHLIRRFGAEVNEAAEDFMTPRDVVHLATTLLLDPDDQLFRDSPGLIRTLYDPTCGTGGFLTDAMNYVEGFQDRSKVPPVLIPYGQELEPETHAVALAGMLLRTIPTDPGRDLSKNIAGPCSTLSQDQHSGSHFHYCLSNPPFGKKWEKDQAAVLREHREKGFSGRFGPGTPRVSDGSMLFLLHLVDKLERPDKGGGRGAIILSGSPLFTGNAGQGESEIRRWLLENDQVEAIVALPTDIFFRTGIGTYIWILSNKKADERKGIVQLIDATGIHSPMRKAEGNKRRFINDDQIGQIARIYAAFEESEVSRLVPYQDFGYRRIKVQRPLRLKFVIDQDGLERLKQEKAWERLDANSQAAWEKLLTQILGQTQKHDLFRKNLKQAAAAEGLGKVTAPMAKALVAAFGVRDEDADPVKEGGEIVPDKELEDFENIPLGTQVADYMEREVLPHAKDAWVDEAFVDERDEQVGRVGYEINFNRYFYKYVPPRDLHVIDAELQTVEKEIAKLLSEVAAQKKLIANAVARGLNPDAPTRDSGIAWIGRIPSHWTVKRAKFLFTLAKRSPRETDEIVTAFRDGQVTLRSNRRTEGFTNAIKEAGYQGVRKGDLVIHAMDAFAGAVGVSDSDGKCTPVYSCCVPKRDATSEFYAHCVRTMATTGWIESLSKGIRERSSDFRWAMFADQQLPVPPVDEQIAISRFIAAEQVRIAAVIEKAELLISLLREHKVASITAISTGKLDLREAA